MAYLMTHCKMPLSGCGPYDLRIVHQDNGVLMLEEQGTDALGEPLWRPALPSKKLGTWLDLIFVDAGKKHATVTPDGSMLVTLNMTNIPKGARGIVATWTERSSNSHAADETHHAVYGGDVLPVVGRVLTPLSEGHRMNQVLLGAIAVLNGYPPIWSSDL